MKIGDLTGNTLPGITLPMKVTVKGQITIPLALRERFGLRPGTEVEFVAGQETLQLKARKASKKTGRASDLWLTKAAGSARPGMSTDQLMALTRGED
jgi:AbrB family looped-hinge helix DNA binding protein